MAVNLDPGRIPAFANPRADNDGVDYTWLPNSMGHLSGVTPPSPTVVQATQQVVAQGGPNALAARHYLHGLRTGAANAKAAQQQRAQIAQEKRYGSATMLAAVERLMPPNAMTFTSIDRNPGNGAGADKGTRAYCPGDGRVLSVDAMGQPIGMATQPASRQEVIASETCAMNHDCPLCANFVSGFHGGVAIALRAGQGLIS